MMTSLTITRSHQHGKSIHTLHIGDTKLIANIAAVLGSGIYISGGFVLVILLVVVVMRLLR
jgi:hypothetical protein